MKAKRKGFTLVELLVVIAILAILATVSVIGYLSFTEKAKQSNDESLITQLNTVLEGNEVLDGKPSTMYEALAQVEDAGYSVEKLTPTSAKNEFLWDQDDNKFVIVSADELEKTTDPSLWVIVDTQEELTQLKDNYSVYLSSVFSTTETTLDLTNGFDAGDYVGFETINFSTEETVNVTIRMNGGTLNVDAPNATVNHYGESDLVDITSVAMDSYHEYGMINGNITIQSGHIVITAYASVESVIITGDSVSTDIENDSTEVYVSSDVISKPTISGSEFVLADCVSSLEELNSAISNGNNIVLLNDIEGDIKITNAPNKISFNLNGCKITGSVVIENSYADVLGNGYISSKSIALSAINSSNVVISSLNIESNNMGLYVTTNAILTIDYANVTSQEFSLSAQNGGNLIVNDGLYFARDNAVIATNGTPTYKSSSIIVNGGVYNGNIISNGYIACGIYLANNDDLTVNAGVFNITNGVGILIRSGRAVIGRNVEINLFIDGSIQSGKIGDSTIVISTNCSIVKDEQSDYPGGLPTITNNSKYEVYSLD